MWKINCVIRLNLNRILCNLRFSGQDAHNNSHSCLDKIMAKFAHVLCLLHNIVGLCAQRLGITIESAFWTLTEGRHTSRVWQFGCRQTSLLDLLPGVEESGIRAELRQHVIVLRGRFATQKLMVLDLDIMVRLDVNTKE